MGVMLTYDNNRATIVGNDEKGTPMRPKLTQNGLKAVGKNLGPPYRLSVADAEKR